MGEKTCIENPKHTETRKRIQEFNKKFYFYVIFAFLYGFIFLNYIDLITPGGITGGYHLWLSIMYFFPFAVLVITFPKNWALVVGLGLLSSLMNDVFYGLVGYFMGAQINLGQYYNLWLIPSDAILFQLNLGFATIPVYSWMMALSIYARIVIVIFLLRRWKSQEKIICLNEAQPKKERLLANWWKTKLALSLNEVSLGAPFKIIEWVKNRPSHVTVKQKGQVTLPIELRSRLGIEEGAILEIKEKAGKPVGEEEYKKLSPNLTKAGEFGIDQHNGYPSSGNHRISSNRNS